MQIWYVPAIVLFLAVVKYLVLHQRGKLRDVRTYIGLPGILIYSYLMFSTISKLVETTGVVLNLSGIAVGVTAKLLYVLVIDTISSLLVEKIHIYGNNPKTKYIEHLLFSGLVTAFLALGFASIAIIVFTLMAVTHFTGA